MDCKYDNKYSGWIWRLYLLRFLSLGVKSDFIKSILFSRSSNQFCSKVVNKFTEVTNFLNEYPISDEDIIIQDVFKNNLSK